MGNAAKTADPGQARSSSSGVDRSAARRPWTIEEDAITFASDLRDWELQKAVLGELRSEPSVTSSRIGVTACEGVVGLSGYVESFGEKLAAETATRRVKGVKAIVDGIEVRLPFDLKRDDDEVARQPSTNARGMSPIPPTP